MKIIGIDPGVATTGYSIVEYEADNVRLLDYGTILTSKESNMYKRLDRIFHKVFDLIKTNMPCEVVVEKLFFAKNIKTAVAVAEARGVIILAAAQNQAGIYEYTPLQVKQSITGSGNAGKEQVQNMVQRILNMDEIPKPDDAADAIALALTHIQVKKYNSMVGR